MINAERKRRHMVEDDSYLSCAVDVETILYALQDCTFTRNIWNSVIPREVSNIFFTLSFHDWLMWNVQDKT